MRFALVAGEISGDILGAAIIHALKVRFPEATFYGVAGPRMIEAGCEPVETIEALSVMGIAEVLRVLPRLFALRAQLVERFVRDEPDCFIGIDAPDFNLGLEKRLKQRGIKTVHVVSPTVWAWRKGRLKGIAESVSLMLCLYPFEKKFYDEHGVRAEYIGHPLADELDERVTQAQARQRLALPVMARTVAILPGSRAGEIKCLAERFVKAAAWLHARDPQLQFVTPLAKPALRAALEQAIAEYAPTLSWRLLDGQSREAMRAADVVLIASGTATLECLLLGRPMVIAYRTAPLTAWLMLKAGLLKTRHVGLPNLLAAEPLVPEFLQDAVVPEPVGEAVLKLLDDAWLRQRQLDQFGAVRRELKRDAGALASQAIKKLLYA